MSGSPRALAVLTALLLAAPAVALGSHFPSGNPDESVRAHTPNDRDFDRCEPDNDGGQQCNNVFDQSYQRFGFAPSATQLTATYKNLGDEHIAQLMAQNTLAGRNAAGQIPGVSADRAWKFTAGRPEVQVAILDTGIRWNSRRLRSRVALNEEELPTPACGKDDCNDDGQFGVDDFAGQVEPTAGNDEADAFMDGSDLIAAFSDGTDSDGNGYVDDIAGWDFFDDDNDPYDASSYASAANHGTGRAEEAVEQGHDDDGSLGLCPKCTFVPLRVFDTFVVDTNYLGLAVAYAADNEIEVVEIATGGLTNSHFSRDAFEDAYERGVFLAVVSSDLNTANHNFPTFYDESMQVQGTVADAHGLGSEAPEVGNFLDTSGIPTSGPVSTWFRNSGTTQYGAHAHIVMPGSTGSQATGQASGAAALIASYGREEGRILEPNEIKQLLTTTAVDVVPENTTGIGTPDPSQVGWDQHFGYGLPDLGRAMERIEDGRIPPQVLITGPPWFTPHNVEKDKQVQIAGRVSARWSNAFSWQLEWAPGVEPPDDPDSWTKVGDPQMSTVPVEGVLGTIDLEAVRDALDASPTGGATVDPTAPAKGSPLDRDPNEPAFTVRVRVWDTRQNLAEDRKQLFAYRDTGEHPGWPRRLESGGESSQRLWDVDGDRKLDVITGDSSGTLSVLDHTGQPVPSFNNGQPVRTRVYANVHAGAPAFSRVAPPREPLRTPSIGDIDGDLVADIVVAAGEHVYAWRLDGTELPGFPVRLDPSLSRPQDRTRDNHVKRGFVSSTVLADLKPDEAGLEIVVGAMDQHLYAWDGDGEALPGFPLKLRDPSLPGAEIITTPAVGHFLDDADPPEIVSATQEFDDDPSGPACDDLPTCLFEGVTHVLAHAIGGSGRTYAVGFDGTTWKVLPGWPVSANGAVPDALPFVAPGIDHVLGDVDGDETLEAIGGLATGDVHAYDADGTTQRTYDPSPATGEHVDKSKVLNLFEYPIVADLDGLPGLEVMKGGLTLAGLVNVGVTVGQNLPYNHVVQAWNGQTGVSLPAFPQAVEDYQLLSSPAVGDIGGSPGNELVVGTGLYLVRAFNAAGVEAPGFPKFTGGWNFAVPAMGDADGDGTLDIAIISREGNAFLWEGTEDACAGNDQWWTSRHDERSTGAYGTDTRPPYAPANMAATDTPTGLAVTFERPGDDWGCGEASKWRMVTSDEPIDSPSDGTPVMPDTAAANDTESVEVPRAGLQKYLGVAFVDDAGNWGLASHTAVPVDVETTPTATAAETATGTATATETAAETATETATETSTATETATQTQTQTATATETATQTATETATATATPTRTQTGTATPEGTPSPRPSAPPGQDSAGRSDASPPRVAMTVSRYGTSRGRILVRWNASEPATFEVSVRRLPSRRFRRLATGARVTALRHRGLQGQAYEFRVRARDAAGNVDSATARSIVPYDQARRTVRYRGGWDKAVRRERAFGGTMAVARRHGARAVFKFRGRGVRVFAGAASRSRPERLTVILDGRRKTVAVRGSGGVRGRPAFSSSGLARHRTHTLVIVATEGVLLDAVAVIR